MNLEKNDDDGGMDIIIIIVKHENENEQPKHPKMNIIFANLSLAKSNSITYFGLSCQRSAQHRFLPRKFIFSLKNEIKKLEKYTKIATRKTSDKDMYNYHFIWTFLFFGLSKFKIQFDSFITSIISLHLQSLFEGEKKKEKTEKFIRKDEEEEILENNSFLMNRFLIAIIDAKISKLWLFEGERERRSIVFDQPISIIFFQSYLLYFWWKTLRNKKITTRTKEKKTLSHDMACCMQAPPPPS